MSWQKARFKGQEVWAKVSELGSLDIDGGRVEIRYQSSPGAKVYRAGAGRLELIEGAPLESLEEGSAAETPSTTSRSAGTPGGFGKAGTRTATQKAMAAEAAEKLVASLEGQSVLCFTDGACKGNPGPAGSGAAVWLLDGQRGESSLALGVATNNVAELTAIDLALDMLDASQVGPEVPGAIFTDSAYAHGVLARGWKAKANQNLVAKLRTRLGERPKCVLYWVAGHVGVEGNERADALANQGVSGRTETRWY